METVEGMRDLQIPSGIQPGEAVKLPRMGVPDINRPSVRGDHHFIVNVLIPKEIRSNFLNYSLFLFLLYIAKVVLHFYYVLVYARIEMFKNLLMLDF